MTRLPLILALAALPFAAPAIAQTPAPAPAPAASSTTLLPLSQVLSGIEAEPDFVQFTDVEWDDRALSWNIEYKGTNGRTVTVEIAGATGEPITN